MEVVVNNSINFLDITISIDKHKILFNVYRKSTATDIIIPNDSCHPPEQKLAGIRYMVSHLSTYPINEIYKEKEYDTIKQILYNNKYDVKILDRIKAHKEAKTKTKTKWAKLTHV